MAKKNLPAGTELAPKGSVTSAPSGFVARSAIAPTKGLIVRSMSPMLKPLNWPKIDGQNAVLVGTFTKVFDTAEFTEGTGKNAVKKKGTGVEIVPPGAPVGVALPVTATLRTGLEITGDGKAATSPFVGRIVEVELLPEKIPSNKGNAAWHFVVAIHPPAPAAALK